MKGRWGEGGKRESRERGYMYIQNVHTHTHTHTHRYIYLQRVKERERGTEGIGRDEVVCAECRENVRYCARAHTHTPRALSLSHTKVKENTTRRTRTQTKG